MLKRDLPELSVGSGVNGVLEIAQLRACQDEPSQLPEKTETVRAAL